MLITSYLLVYMSSQIWGVSRSVYKFYLFTERLPSFCSCNIYSNKAKNTTDIDIGAISFYLCHYNH